MSDNTSMMQKKQKRHHRRKRAMRSGPSSDLYCSYVVFPKVIAQIVAEYARQYVLRDFMAGVHLNMHFIWTNPFAFDYLESIGMSIANCSKWITCNPDPRALEWLENHPEDISWAWIYENPAAAYLVKQFEGICPDESHIPYASCSGLPIDAYLDSQRYSRVSPMPFPECMCHNWWSDLSKNSSDEALDVLLKYPNKIDWLYFQANTNPRAIEVIIAQPGTPDYYGFKNHGLANEILHLTSDDCESTSISENTDIRVLKRVIYEMDIIDGNTFISANPSIFELENIGPLIKLLT